MDEGKMSFLKLRPLTYPIDLSYSFNSIESIYQIRYTGISSYVLIALSKNFKSSNQAVTYAVKDQTIV